MKKEQELVVITKTYDLILRSCNHTSHFPRNHRYDLGERIERHLYGLPETLIQAKYTPRAANACWSRRKRSRAVGDGRSVANKVRQHEGRSGRRRARGNPGERVGWSDRRAQSDRVDTS